VRSLSSSRTCVRVSGTERGAAPRLRQGQCLGQERSREKRKTSRPSAASGSNQPPVDTACCSPASESSQAKCRNAFYSRVRERGKKRDGKRGENEGERGRDGTRKQGRERERRRERHLARVYARAGWADSSATREQHLSIYDATCSFLLRLSDRSFGIKPRACCWDGSLPAGL